MKTRSLFALATLTLLSAPNSATACEPIVGFIKAVGGPTVLTGAIAVLIGVVLLKSFIFARYQSRLTFYKAMAWMLGANVLTSIIGLVAAAMVARGGMVFIAVPVVWALCLLPAQRLITLAPIKLLGRCTPRALAFAMTAGLVLSVLLFNISSTVHDSAGAAAYWIVKIAAVYLGLTIGIVLTAFWEEWIVWYFLQTDEGDFSFVQPVIRANVTILLAVVIISAAVMIPTRLGLVSVLASAKPKAALVEPKPAL